MTSSDCWEVGASGRVYGCGLDVATLVERHSRRHEDSLVVRDFRVGRLAEGVWLVMYELDQRGRRSRRATIWKQSGSAWVADYPLGNTGRHSVGNDVSLLYGVDRCPPERALLRWIHANVAGASVHRPGSWRIEADLWGLTGDRRRPPEGASGGGLVDDDAPLSRALFGPCSACC